MDGPITQEEGKVLLDAGEPEGSVTDPPPAPGSWSEPRSVYVLVMFAIAGYALTSAINAPASWSEAHWAFVGAAWAFAATELRHVFADRFGGRR